MSTQSATRTVTAKSEGQIAPGTRIGKYEIVDRIASGGMAEIYLARACGIYGFEKHVVLKRILPQYAASADFVRMFLKEARVAASLDHANIAHVYEIGEAGGDVFFTMEYLHGEDLRHIIRTLARRGQRVPLEQALVIAIGAASGLHFAHDKRGADGRSLGIVHRDISPANVVVTYDGGVKIVDFGIAKLAADPDLSQRYALKGKLAYMSAEQLHHEPVDRRSDVFALGVVIYEMTTGTRLFKGATEVETMQAVLAGAVPLPSTRVASYPPMLERIVLRTLRRAPDERYQSARDLQLDLEGFAHEERIRLSPASLAEWMERTFGPKQEIWHTISTRSGGTAPTDSLVGGGTMAATKILAQPAPRASHDDAARVAEIPADIAFPGRRRRWTWLAIPAALALAAAGGALWQARGRLGVPLPAASTAPVVLVAEGGHVAVERELLARAPENAALTAPAEPAGQRPQPPALLVASGPVSVTTAGGKTRSRHAVESRAPRPRGDHSAGNSADYSAILARREKDIRRCFLDHPGGRSPTTEISLRFEVGSSGHVDGVAVLPPMVGGTPLGACLAAVGKSTIFPKQTAPLTFRIPLTVQFATGATSGP